jgi:tetratricopeptide (TPR) repeat protein
MGSALKDRTQLNEAIFCYQRAIALNPDFVIALANLANVYKDLGRVTEAIELYQRAIKIKPDFVEVLPPY